MDAKSPAVSTGSRTPPGRRIEEMMNDFAFDLGVCHLSARIQEREAWTIPVKGFAFCVRHTLALIKTSRPFGKEAHL